MNDATINLHVANAGLVFEATAGKFFRLPVGQCQYLIGAVHPTSVFHTAINLGTF